VEQGLLETFGHKGCATFMPKILRAGFHGTKRSTDKDGEFLRNLNGIEQWLGTAQAMSRLNGPELQFEGFFRLNGETDRDIGRAVEPFENLVAKQTTILALGAGPGCQLNAAIAGMTGGTSKV
jgi:hypothetical protein